MFFIYISGSEKEKRRKERKQGLVKRMCVNGEESEDTRTEVSVEYSIVRKREKKLEGKVKEEKARLYEERGKETQRLLKMGGMKERRTDEVERAKKFESRKV